MKMNPISYNSGLRLRVVYLKQTFVRKADFTICTEGSTGFWTLFQIDIPEQYLDI